MEASDQALDSHLAGRRIIWFGDLSILVETKFGVLGVWGSVALRAGD
jgi:hypothetical protein